MNGLKRNSMTMLLTCCLVTQTGCIALNIPSARYHDPSDHGGLFGHWRHGSGHHGLAAGDLHGSPQHVLGVEPDHPLNSAVETFPLPPQQHAALCLDGGPLGCDPLDPAMHAGKDRELPEIPWPRFHPIPTRPVFQP